MAQTVVTMSASYVTQPASAVLSCVVTSRTLLLSIIMIVIIIIYLLRTEIQQVQVHGEQVVIGCAKRLKSSTNGRSKGNIKNDNKHKIQYGVYDYTARVSSLTVRKRTNCSLVISTVVRRAGAPYRRVRIPESSDLCVCVCYQRTKSLFRELVVSI